MQYQEAHAPLARSFPLPRCDPGGLGSSRGGSTGRAVEQGGAQGAKEGAEEGREEDRVGEEGQEDQEGGAHEGASRRAPSGSVATASALERIDLASDARRAPGSERDGDRALYGQVLQPATCEVQPRWTFVH